MPYRIIGKAAPFNVENSYRELFLPGAFDEFLATPKAKKLPMNLGHDEKTDIGVWHHLHVAGGWLHCQGVLDDRETEYNVRHGLDQLSIGYANTDRLEAANAATNFEEHIEALSGGRAGRGIDYIARRLSELPAEQCIRKLMELEAGPEDWRERMLLQAAAANETIERITRATLQEISIVDHGAFKGTQLHWEKI